MEALQGRYSDVEMGSYPFNRAGRFGTRLVLRATEAERLDAAAGELDDLIVELGSEADWE